MGEDKRAVTESGGIWKNRYRIERELSRGGSAVVYLARDEQLRSKRVVIKVLHQEMSPDPELQRKLQLEIEALAKIDHLGVVGVFDVGDTPDGAPFLVTPYVEGITLRADMKGEGMSFPRTSAIIRQVSNALTAAHEKGIHHRDLKPENIMLTRSGADEEYVKLIDFGIAAAMDSRVEDRAGSSMVVGTAAYMAPEQALGKCGAPSDIYALGVIAFEMLTGKRPDVLSEGVAVKPRELRPSIPEAAEAIILKALSFKPEDRPESARGFADVFCGAFVPDASVARAAHSGASVAPPSSLSKGLELAYVLFMDIVGYSKQPMDVQSEHIQRLQQIVRSTDEFQEAQQSDQLFSLPTGDGMALVFFRSPIAPVQCAIEISRMLRAHPEIELRMGIHSGPVYRIADINTNRNVAGGGINIAQRVMDCGDAGHILLSNTMADILRQLSHWVPLLHDLHQVEVKHGVVIHIVNLFTDGIGNPELPKKLQGKRLTPVTPAGGKASRQMPTRLQAIVMASVVLVVGLAVSLYWYAAAARARTAAPTPASTPSLTPPSTPPPLAKTLNTASGVMILIPKGDYLSGLDKKRASLPAFYIDQTEVTNEAFRQFCLATKRELPAGLKDAKSDFPVVNVTIDEAREFAHWAEKRLPTQGEWEKAARGTEGKEYPWGDDSNFNGANVTLPGSAQTRALASVMDFPSGDSPFGVRQMAGNVWELVDEIRSPSKDALDLFKSNAVLVPPPTAAENWYLIAGGSYSDKPEPAWDFAYIPGRFRSDRIGFRCAKDAR